MNVNELISSGLLESYVLGTTSAEETALIQSLCKKHPELLAEIEAIENGLLHVSAQLAPPLNPALKDKIAASLQFNEERPPVEAGAKEISLNTKRTLSLYKLGIAASLFLLVCSFVYTLALHKKLNQLNSELALLTSEKSYMAEQMEVQQAAMTVTREQLQLSADPMVKKIALNGMNSMANKAATVLWNTQTKELYFNGSSMKPPAGKQYQLWAIVNGKPVDAGMIDMNGDTVFQKMKLMPEAQAFAVTIEKMGGSPTPSLETMCLLGNV